MKTDCRLLAIHGSPNPDGRSSSLHRAFIDRFISAGAEVREIHVYDMNIQPCTACGSCSGTRGCPVNDDMREVYPLITNAGVISVSAPLYFSSVPSQLKSLIDRCQVFWEAGKASAVPSPKKGAFICTAGSEYRNMFTGALLTMRHYFNTINARFNENEAVLVPGLDEEKKINLEIINRTVRLSESIITGFTR